MSTDEPSKSVYIKLKFLHKCIVKIQKCENIEFQKMVQIWSNRIWKTEWKGFAHVDFSNEKICTSEKWNTLLNLLWA